MRTFFSQKKFILLALLEDMLLIFFLLSLIVSGMEILLPGSMANRLPLAPFFTIFAFLVLLYTNWIHKEKLSYPHFSLPTTLALVVAVFLILVALFMTRAFGVWGAGIQIAIIVLAFFFWLAPLEKKISKSNILRDSK